MTQKLFKVLPILIFLFGGFNIYTLYTEHVETEEQLKQQLDTVESQLIKTKKKVAGIKQNEEKLKEFETKLAEVKKQIDELKTKMPTESERTAVLQELTNTAQELNLKEVTFNPVPKTDKGVYFVNSISLSGKGTYLQFLILFEKVQSSQRFFNIDNFTLSESPGDTKGRFIFVNVKADLQTFEYNEASANKAPTEPPKT